MFPGNSDLALNDDEETSALYVTSTKRKSNL